MVDEFIEAGKEVDEDGIEDAFELLTEVNERVRSGLWVGDCFVYNNAQWRLNYCVGGEVRNPRFFPLSVSSSDFPDAGTPNQKIKSSPVLPR